MTGGCRSCYRQFESQPPPNDSLSAGAQKQTMIIRRMQLLPPMDGRRGRFIRSSNGRYAILRVSSPRAGSRVTGNRRGFGVACFKANPDTFGTPWVPVLRAQSDRSAGPHNWGGYRVHLLRLTGAVVIWVRIRSVLIRDFFAG